MALLGYTLIFCLFLCILRIAVLRPFALPKPLMMWKFINFQLRSGENILLFRHQLWKKPPVTKGRSSRKGTGFTSKNEWKTWSRKHFFFFFFSCFGVLFIIFLRFKILKELILLTSKIRKKITCPILKFGGSLESVILKKPSSKDLSRKFCRLGAFEPSRLMCTWAVLMSEYPEEW